MPFKRPAPEPHTRPDPQSESLRPSKRTRMGPLEKAIPNVKIYIVQAKLDPSGVSELFKLAERHADRVCSDVEDADVIITAIHMRRRLERHVLWDVAVSMLHEIVDRLAAIFSANVGSIRRSRKRW